MKILQQSGLKSHDMMNPVTFWQLDKNQKGLDFDFKKEQLNSSGNIIIRFLAETSMRRSIPLTCLFVKYEAAAS